MLGADIFVTVGNEEKVEYLIKTFNIPRSRIFRSRDASFLTDVMRETNGRGVDFVLNSLSGDLLHASWKCVAEFGMLLEIGKRDLIGHGKLDMDVFEANRAYCGIDLGLVMEKRPAVTKTLLETIIEYYKNGSITPIYPTKLFTAASVEDCFRYMQKGQHIGKIVVSMEDILGIHAERPPKKATFDPTASYLIVGGVGGLGKPVSTWMVDNGARHLIFLSRSAGTTAEDRAFFQELNSRGCSATAVQGSVSDLDTVIKAVLSAKTPLKGVLQMSMILRDQDFGRMTHDEWITVVSPRVQGTWNLHEATRACSLDFFVMFSSLSGVVGTLGQANYASANAFLDAFTQFRHSLELTSSSIDIGFMEDTGYLSENPAQLARLRAAGNYRLREQHLLDALTIAIANGRPDVRSLMGANTSVNRSQFITGLRSLTSLADPGNQQSWRRDRRSAIYHIEKNSNTAGVSTRGNDKLRKFLQEVSAEPELLRQPANIVFIAQQLAAKLCEYTMKTVDDESEFDISASLQESGMDSLVAIEMRWWWKQYFGFDISVLEMLGMGTFEGLAQHAANGLLAKYVEEPSTDHEPGSLVMKAP